VTNTRPGYPTDLPGATGPLPRGWHRVTWRRLGFTPDAPPFWMVGDITSMVMLKTSLETDPAVVQASVKAESWSDFPPTD
jgi:hypothetical protein